MPSRRRSGSSRGRRGSGRDAEPIPEADEVQAFHDGRMQRAEAAVDDDDLDAGADEQDVEVFGVQSSDEDDADDSDDVYGEDEEEEEEAEDDEEGARGVTAGWGKRRGAFYQQDHIDVDLSEDERERQDEEEEAERLQRQRMAELDEDDLLDDTLQQAVVQADRRKAGKKEQQQRQTGSEEMGEQQLQRDFASLSAAEKRAILESDAAEMQALSKHFVESIAEVRNTLAPVLMRLKEADVDPSKGMSFLELKNQLLLSYTTHLAFYFVLKAEGQSVKDHPVIAKLVQIRTMLERVRPLDKKLKTQIERVLRASSASVNGAGGAVRANPAAMLGDDADGSDQGDEGDGADDDDKYVAPKLNPMLEEDQAAAKAQRREQRRIASLGKHSVLRELAQQMSEAPMEIGGATDESADRNALAAKYDEEMEERARFEEDNFVRVSMTKKDRKRLQKLQQQSQRAVLDDSLDFIDDLADPYARRADGEAEDDDLALGASIAAARQAKRKLDSHLNDLQGSLRRAKHHVSADADLPYATREDRARAQKQREESRKRKRQDRFDDGDSGDDADDRFTYSVPPAEPVQEDQYYEQAERAAKKRRAERSERYAVEPRIPQAEESVGEDDKRGITYQISKNRGLVPHRKKSTKNPRKKLREKYEKAVSRRRGAVTDYKTRDKPYAGETTGIKKSVSKSRRF